MYPVDKSVTSLERRERIVNGWGAACAADADVNGIKFNNFPLHGKRRRIDNEKLNLFYYECFVGHFSIGLYR